MHHTIRDVLSFWFDHDAGEDLAAWMRQAQRWFRGGMDEAIVERFTETVQAAEQGELDHWATTAEGRLALILVLDQFPRSVYRGTARAYASDPQALRLCLEGLDNGHYDEITDAWQRTFFTMPMGHAEGPDHLERIDRLIVFADQLYADAPASLKPLWDVNRNQPRRAREVIARFGRHPHRNEVLGRESTDAERAYLAVGEFPHASPTPQMKALMELASPGAA